MNSISNNPYVGPRTFLESDRDRFFGRDREARDLLALVVSEPLVLFYAQSGAGKSSLVNTRLIPDLRKRGFRIITGRVSGDTLPGTEVGNIFVFNLLRSLAPKEITSATFMTLSLKDFFCDTGNKSLLDIQAGESEPSRAHVLIIDQFEEIFRTHQEAWEKREDFFVQLAEAMEADPYLWVVLVMREDFIASLDPYLPLLPGRLRMRYYMQRLERPAALEAIKKPVKDLRPFAEGVAERLVDDLRSVKVYKPDGTLDLQPGQYVEPVQLQVVCANLWQNLRPEGDQITEEDLREVGDVDISLGSYYADRVKTTAASLNVKERKIREWFADKLISSSGVRMPVLREPDGTSGGMEDRVIQALPDLVRPEQRGGAIFYELTHDRLVKPIIANNKIWEDEHFSPLQRQADLWEGKGQEDKWLVSDQALAEVELWAQENPDDVSEIEEKFLKESRKHQELITAERDAQQRELELSQKLAEEQAQSARRARRALVYTVIFIGITVIALFTAIFGYLARQEATQQEAIARSNILTTIALDKLNSQLDMAILLGLEADSILPGSETQSNLFRNKLFTYLPGSKADSTNASYQVRRALITILQKVGRLHDYLNLDGTVKSFQFSPDGSLFAVLEDKGASLWKIDSKNPDRQVPGNFDSTSSIVFNPNGNSFASLTTEGVYLWDLAGNQLGGPYGGESSSVYATAFSPDGKIVASSGKDGSIILWDVDTGETLGPPLTEHTQWINSVAFSPDGKTLVSASDDQTAILWDVSDPQNPNKWAAISGFDHCVAKAIFNPQKNYIATSECGVGTIMLWDITRPKHPVKINSFEKQGDGNYALAFSPDGKILASGSQDGTIALWDLSNPKKQNLLAIIAASSEDLVRVYSVDISSNGKMLASGYSDGSVILWDISKPEQPKQIGEKLVGHAGKDNNTVACVKFSPDGKILASAGFDGRLILWQMTPPQMIGQPLNVDSSPVNSIDFRFDGNMIVTSTEEGLIQLWNVSNAKMPVKIERNMRGRTNIPKEIEFNKDGSILTLHVSQPTEFSSDEKTFMVDAIHHNLIGMGEIVFEDPQIKLVLYQVHNEDMNTNEIHAMDTSTGKEIGKPLPGTFLSVSSNRATIAYQTMDESQNSVIQLWDLNGNKPIGQPIQGEFLAIDPDGRILVYRDSTDNGKIVFWDAGQNTELSSIASKDINGSPILSGNGKILAYEANSVDEEAPLIHLIDTSTGQPVFEAIKTQPNWFIDRLSEEGKILFYTSIDANGNQIIGTLNTETGKEIGTPQIYTGYLNNYSEANQRVIYGIYNSNTGESTIRIINTSIGQEIAQLPGSYINFIPDEDIVIYSASTGNSINIVSTIDGRNIGQVTGSYLDVVNDGKFLVYNDNGVNLFDIVNRKNITDPIKGTYLGLSPDGKILATSIDNHHISFWDMARSWPLGEPVGAHMDGTSVAALSPDGKTLAWVDKADIHLQDVKSGQILNVNEPYVDHFSNEISGQLQIFSPGSSFMAVVDTNSSTATIWDLNLKQQVADQIPSSSLTFSPDGKYLAAGDPNTNTTALWELSTGKQVINNIHGMTPAFIRNGTILEVSNSNNNTTTFWNTITRVQLGDEIPGTNLYINSDGTGAAAVDYNTDTATFWDLNNGKQLGNEIQGNYFISDPNGRSLVIANSKSNTITIRDLSTGHQIGAEFPGTSASFSPDGKLLAVGNSSTNATTLWNANKHQQIGDEIVGMPLSFSPDGSLLAVENTNTYTTTIWDLNTRLPISDEIPGASPTFISDGKTVLVGNSNTNATTVWDLRTGKQKGHEIPGAYLNFSSGTILSVLDSVTMTTTLWDLKTGKQIDSEINSDYLFPSPDGKLLAIGDSKTNTVTLRDFNTGQLVGTEIAGTSPSFSPDGKFLAVGNPITNATTIQELATGTAILHPIPASTIMFNSNGKILATYGPDGIILRNLDANSPVRLEMEESIGPITDMSFSEDNSKFIAIDEYGNLLMWNAASGKPIITDQTDQPLMGQDPASAKLSPDGKYLVYQNGKQLDLWDLNLNKTDDEVAHLPVNSVQQIAFSPDGKVMAFFDDDTIFLYAFPQLDKLGELSPESSKISGLSLILDDTNVRYLLVRDETGNTQIWDWATRTKVGESMPGNLQFIGSNPETHTAVYIDAAGKLIKFDWEASHEAWKNRLCPLAKRNLTKEEWSLYFSDQKYPGAPNLLTCPDQTTSQ